MQDVVVEKLALKSRAYLGYTASVIVIIANGARVVRSAFLPTLKTARLYAIWARKDTRFGDQKRHFCGNCGTTLYWRATKIKGTGIAGGCFTDDPLPEPTMTVAQGDHVYEWVKLPDHWDRTEPED